MCKAEPASRRAEDCPGASLITDLPTHNRTPLRLCEEPLEGSQRGPQELAWSQPARREASLNTGITQSPEKCWPSGVK